MSQDLNNQINDIMQVGPQKPLGYVLPSDIEAAGLTTEILRKTLGNKGIAVIESPESPAYVNHIIIDGTPRILERPIPNLDVGAWFIAYDEEALQTLLDKPESKHILKENHWPTTARDFVTRVHQEEVNPKTPLFDLIADAFNDKDHPGRTDVNADETFEIFRNQTPLPLNEIPHHVIEQYRNNGIEIPVADDSSKKPFTRYADRRSQGFDKGDS